MTFDTNERCTCTSAGIIHDPGCPAAKHVRKSWVVAEDTLSDGTSLITAMHLGGIEKLRRELNAKEDKARHALAEAEKIKKGEG